MKVSICQFTFIFATIYTAVQARALWGAPYVNTLGNGFGSMFSLRPSTRVPGSKMSTIKFSAYDGIATLYVNEKEYGKATSTTPVVIELPLEREDLVAFKAEKAGSMPGLMATISWGQRKYVSGRDRFTARGDYSKWDAGEQLGWNSVVTYMHKSKGNTRTFCHWDRADKTGIETGKFDSSASYIWRLSSTDGKEDVPVDTTYFRLVIGGENCGVDPQNSNDKTSKKKSDDEDDDDSQPSHRVPQRKQGGQQPGSTSGIEGLSDSVSSEGFCACRYTESKGGDCYDMDDPTADSGKCKPRPCEPKFECAATGEKICVKRRGGMKVVMTSSGSCINVFADDTESLIPYEG
ncbi:hypothetical protein FGB62_26g09 [Gracilaria domingensis]|nr:hypothetical protein FGB62_26g09 [Gracilaria domingensis]